MNKALGQEAGSEVRSMPRDTYWRRVLLAVSITFLTVGLHSLLIRPVFHLDPEYIAIIASINMVASVLAASIAAAVVRRRGIGLVVTSQVLAILLVSALAHS